MYDAVSKKNCGEKVFSNVIVRHGEANTGDIRKQTGFLGWEDTLEEGMATHSSILLWRIPLTKEPRGLLSIGSQNQTQVKPLAHMHSCAHTVIVSNLQKI